jgi:hypothetical protein
LIRSQARTAADALSKNAFQFRAADHRRTGFVRLSETGVELLFEAFSRRYERAATLGTSNLPFNEWTEAFGSERLKGALLDRLPAPAISFQRAEWNAARESPSVA